MLLVSAYGPDARRGNATTVRRYREAALSAGFDVDWAFGEGPALSAAVAERTTGRRFDLLHGHHALRTGPVLAATDLPFVLSEGGTEFELVAGDPRLRTILADAASRAALVLCATEASRAAWLDAGLSRPERTRLLPRAVGFRPALPRPAHGLLRSAHGIAAETLLVLFASGLRPGKDPLRALAVFALLRALVPDVALVFLGLSIDAGLAAEVRRRAAVEPGVFVAETVPAERMIEAYADADVVLNTSRYEGVSNALLEAQSIGRPVVAADIPANVAAVPPDARCAIFRRDEDAAAALATFAHDPGFREREGLSGRDFVRSRFAPAREAEALVAAYREIAPII